MAGRLHNMLDGGNVIKYFVSLCLSEPVLSHLVTTPLNRTSPPLSFLHAASSRRYLELETKVQTKVRKQGEGSYKSLLLVESGYYHYHIPITTFTFKTL